VFTPFHKPPYPYPYGRSIDETTTTTETQKHKIGTKEIEDRRGKLWWGATGVISILSDDSTFVTMMKRK
jgi:hypothetical protein